IFSNEAVIQFKGKENVLLIFYHTSREKFYQTLFEKSSSEEFLQEWRTRFGFKQTYDSEDEIFIKADIDIIPSCLRESKEIILKAQQHHLPSVIQLNEVTAIIHSHSKWSDGSYSIEEMAITAIQRGFQYLVLSDHSKSAFYAN